jgi:hypothetical protein
MRRADRLFDIIQTLRAAGIRSRQRRSPRSWK